MKLFFAILFFVSSIVIDFYLWDSILSGTLTFEITFSITAFVISILSISQHYIKTVSIKAFTNRIVLLSIAPENRIRLLKKMIKYEIDKTKGIPEHIKEVFQDYWESSRFNQDPACGNYEFSQFIDEFTFDNMRKDINGIINNIPNKNISLYIPPPEVIDKFFTNPDFVTPIYIPLFIYNEGRRHAGIHTITLVVTEIDNPKSKKYYFAVMEVDEKSIRPASGQDQIKKPYLGGVVEGLETKQFNLLFNQMPEYRKKIINLEPKKYSFQVIGYGSDNELLFKTKKIVTRIIKKDLYESFNGIVVVNCDLDLENIDRTSDMFSLSKIRYFHKYYILKPINNFKRILNLKEKVKVLENGNEREIN